MKDLRHPNLFRLTDGMLDGRDEVLFLFAQAHELFGDEPQWLGHYLHHIQSAMKRVDNTTAAMEANESQDEGIIDYYYGVIRARQTAIYELAVNPRAFLRESGNTRARNSLLFELHYSNIVRRLWSFIERELPQYRGYRYNLNARWLGLHSILQLGAWAFLVRRVAPVIDRGIVGRHGTAI